MCMCVTVQVIVDMRESVSELAKMVVYESLSESGTEGVHERQQLDQIKSGQVR